MKVQIVVFIVCLVKYSLGLDGLDFLSSSFSMIASIPIPYFSSNSHNVEETQGKLEDAIWQVNELIESNGYPCETHTVVTPDGYVLTLHRIPHGKNGYRKNNSSVFLQHGILMSSADWLIPGPNKALGYILADAGYDVWMSNNRGNKYSRNHTYLDPESGEYWNFSWHEIGLYDVTTMIDYILNFTNQEQLFYIGHSQGTTVFYVMCSEKPEYNEKIKAMVSLSPIAYMTDTKSPILQEMSRFGGGLEILLALIGAHEFSPNNGILRTVGSIICKEESVTTVLCSNALFVIGGFSDAQTNITLLPIIMKHTPSGSSTKQFLHYIQEMNSGEFQKWDYGSKNVEHYGTETPPKYLLEKVTSPVYLFCSKSDWLSGENDVRRLRAELKNVKGVYLIKDEGFNHLDYLFGVQAPELVYNDVINVLNKY